MEANPYSTPAANLYGTSTGGGDVVAASTIAQLAGTRPWVKFLSVLMWIFSVLAILASVGLLIAGLMGVSANGNPGLAAMGGLVPLGIFYSLMTLLILYPTMKLSKYAACIRRLKETHSVADLDAALTEQRRFWKFYGILMLLYLCLLLIGIVAAIALPGVMMMNRPGAGM